MPDPAKPIFLVDAGADPVLVCITGRASFANSASLKEFFAEMIRRGKDRFVINFEKCSGMDSTFLGVLAGTAIELRRKKPPGTLTLSHVGERNLELIRNLGLHRLTTVLGDAGPSAAKCGEQALPVSVKSESESARLVLEAHENLIAADPNNAAKFQDVLTFLRNRIEPK